MTIRHIVMWRVRGDDSASRARNLALLKAEFESLRGRVPGLLHLEVGIDTSRIDYACDAVLVSDFDTPEALAAYADHPEHLRVRRALGDLRIARHQVDYELPPGDKTWASASGAAPIPAPPSGDKQDVQAV